MPSIDDILENNVTASNFSFSGTRIDQLGATEYTLVGIAADNTGSVQPFAKELEACIQEVVKACSKSPRADNLLLRLTTFNSKVEEKHGFKELQSCNLNDYQNFLQPHGPTALYDASLEAIEALLKYSEKLSDADFTVNAIKFVLTDGDDNCSTFTVDRLKKAFKDSIQSEKLESIRTVLIGVNMNDTYMKSKLEAFSKQAGFDQFVAMEDASAKSLAKLAAFVSQSISSQSNSLGTGQPSQPISITF
jgi:uncharacterized protein YegL